MAAHKLDQLFKKKLNKHVSEPSDEAWNKMEAMLDQPTSKSIWFYYKVAAAITLLMIVGWATYKLQLGDIRNGKLAEIDREIIEDVAQNNPLITKKTEKVETITTERINQNSVVKERLPKTESFQKKQIALQPQEAIIVEQNIVKEKEVPVVEEIINQDEEMLAINETSGYSPEKVESLNNQPEQQEKQETSSEKKRKPIRIIYKRGKRKTQPQTMLAENDTTNRKKFNFNSIIDATKNITSGDLLADIRSAKDDFFSQGLDFKKLERFKNENSNK